MAVIDFAKIFDGPKAEIAILSTYDFDPLYFENRLLRQNTMNDARRILIFMDQNCYYQLGRNEIVPKYLNQRYLLVPVNPQSGVFHPKLHLLIGRSGARVICGSNNLTQAGSLHNLEILSLVHTDKGQGLHENDLVIETLDFFRQCILYCEKKAGGIAESWLDDLKIDYAWLNPSDSSSVSHRRIDLVHTLRTSPWKWLTDVADGETPLRFHFVSPFYDKDLRLLARVRKSWPKTPVSIYAQQQSSNLPVEKLSKFKDVALFHLDIPNSRRLHAKLIAVDFDKNTAVLSGSCNFTSAAFDGLNIEAALSIREQAGFMERIFPEDVNAIQVDPSDFFPGDRGEPDPEDENENLFRIWGAALDESGRLTFKYDIQKKDDFQELMVVLKSPFEKDARITASIPKEPSKFRGIQLTKGETTGLSSSALTCCLKGVFKGESIQSPSSWVIHEHRLTLRASGTAAGGDRERIIRDNGQGLTAYLDALAQREGIMAVIDFLTNLNIRFQGGPSVHDGSKIRPPSPGDPTLTQNPPSWSMEFSGEFEGAAFEFVSRHHRNVLTRHARSGNINGLENFLDVFAACNKLLLIHHERGQLTPLKVMNLFIAALYRLTVGGELVSWPGKIEGFIDRILHARSGDRSHVKSALDSYAVSEQAAFTLTAAQRIHMVHVKGCDDISVCLPHLSAYAKKFFRNVGIWPAMDKFRTVLHTYGVADNKEQDRWCNHLSVQSLWEG